MVVDSSQDPVFGRNAGGEAQVGLGAALRRAWIGYQRRLDKRMAEAGFAERALPDGRVLRMCVGPAETTIAEIGRQLGISRQGAGKIVAGLVERGYVTLRPSATDGREKIVALTPRAVGYLEAQRNARRAIERELEGKLGVEGLAALHQLLDALGAHEDATISVYLRQTRHAGALRRPED